MSTDPRSYLKEARIAAEAKDYAKALFNYEYFFEHALDEDSSSLYGVRLSYCLEEWAELGKLYPLAKERMIQRRDDSLKLLNQTNHSEFFHDYIAICEHLNCSDLPIKAFKQFHDENKKLANKVVFYIWDKLVDNKLWSICISYLPDPGAKYSECLSKHDSLVKLLEDYPDMGGDGYEEHMQDWVVRDISHILLVLKNNNLMTEFQDIIDRAKFDLSQRGQESLFSQVKNKVAK